METFVWSHHKFETSYPDSSVRVQFGKSYTFAAPPDAPDQRTFKLHFKGFKYYVDPDTHLVEATTNADLNNMLALEQFYQTHRLFEKFIYPHPVHGNIVVRFAKPLAVPKGNEGGNGVLEDFSLELVEQP